MTQTDVARAAGVHSTTVSQALRNNPSISAATRQRIQDVADKLGYVPDPTLSALASYRTRSTVPRRAQAIAYVTSGETRWGWREWSPDAACHLGARRKALENGYQLEHFWLGEPGMTGQRLCEVLSARAIAGVVLASHRPGCPEPEGFDWNHLTAIKLGDVPHAPGLHRVTNDPTGDIRQAVRRATSAGYRRIGLILPQSHDAATEQGWSVGFTVEQNSLPASRRIPILRGRNALDARPSNTPVTDDQVNIDGVARWYDEFRPDAIVGSYAALRDPLSRLGIRIPADAAFVDLLHEGDNKAVAGVRQSFQRVGELAVEILVGHLQFNLRGLPMFPTTTLVEGVWHPGTSLPENAEPITHAEPRETPVLRPLRTNPDRSRGGVAGRLLASSASSICAEVA